MRNISIRLPEDLVAAYDEAEGGRSALMRRRLSEAVVDGELTGVPADVAALARASAAADDGRIDRRRASFRARCHSFFADRWQSGACTPDDAEQCAESWRTEASEYGPKFREYVDEIVGFYGLEWAATRRERPEWPDTEYFLVRAQPDIQDSDSLPDRLLQNVKEARAGGLGRRETLDKLLAFHPRDRAEAAVSSVYGDKEPEAPEP
jgi:hypothetical protein